MKQAKDSAEFLRPLLPEADTVWAVSEPGQHSGAASGGDHRGIRRRRQAGAPRRGRSAARGSRPAHPARVLIAAASIWRARS